MFAEADSNAKDVFVAASTDAVASVTSTGSPQGSFFRMPPRVAESDAPPTPRTSIVFFVHGFGGFFSYHAKNARESTFKPGVDGDPMMLRRLAVMRGTHTQRQSPKTSAPFARTAGV